jgi:hypothetical protein
MRDRRRAAVLAVLCAFGLAGLFWTVSGSSPSAERGQVVKPYDPLP